MEETSDNYSDYDGITIPIGSYSYDNFTLSPANSTMSAAQIPEEMLFGIPHIVSIVGYSSLFVISATGNLTVFITLFRNRNDKSRVNMFIMHLSIADLIVTFIMMPLEIGWNSTVKWMAGDAACRILLFLRTFGLYLSSFTLVVISLDRYFAILHPLSLNDADQRGKIMLAFAWLFSVFASFPQGVIFHEETHPNHTWYKQCVTFRFFPSYAHELVYNLYTMFAMYGLPLIVITLSYALILRKISMKTRQSKEEMQELNSSNTEGRLRRSAVGNIERARARTLKMTIIIVGVFILCWTPYYVLAIWWWFDRDTARNVDPVIQKGLFMFAVSNSCVNPIVYGLFTINFKREFLRCCCCLKSKWRNAKRSLHTAGGTQLIDGKSIYSRSTHSSLRASTTAVGNTAIKIKMERGPSGDPLLRFIARGDSQCQSNGAMKKSNSERGNQMRDTRHNSNNFLVIHMKEQDEYDF